MLHGRTSLQRVLTSKLNEKQKEIVISPMYKVAIPIIILC